MGDKKVATWPDRPKAETLEGGSIRRGMDHAIGESKSLTETILEIEGPRETTNSHETKGATYNIHIRKCEGNSSGCGKTTMEGRKSSRVPERRGSGVARGKPPLGRSPIKSKRDQFQNVGMGTGRLLTQKGGGERGRTNSVFLKAGHTC